VGAEPPRGKSGMEAGARQLTKVPKVENFGNYQFSGGAATAPPSIGFPHWTSIAPCAIVRSVSTIPGVTRIFKGKSFERFASVNDIEDEDLIEAVEGAEKGLIDADLGPVSSSREWRVKAKASPAAFELPSSFGPATGPCSCMASPRKTGRT